MTMASNQCPLLSRIAQFPSHPTPSALLTPGSPCLLLLCPRRQLGAGGCKSLLAVPISFVSEHIETLEEMDMEYRWV